MTWEELKEKAKEMGASIYISDLKDGFERINYKNIYINNSGMVVVEDKMFGDNVLATVAEHRTPEQMLMIMRGLE